MHVELSTNSNNEQIPQSVRGEKNGLLKGVHRAFKNNHLSMAISMSIPMCENFRHFCRPWLPRWQRILFFCYSQKRVSDQTRIFSTHGFILFLTTILSFNNSPPFPMCTVIFLYFYSLLQKKNPMKQWHRNKKSLNIKFDFHGVFRSIIVEGTILPRSTFHPLLSANAVFMLCFYLIPLRFPSPSLSLRGFI